MLLMVGMLTGPMTAFTTLLGCVLTIFQVCVIFSIPLGSIVRNWDNICNKNQLLILQNLPEGVAVVPADTVDPPVGGPEVGHVAVADSYVLDISPVVVRISL